MDFNVLRCPETDLTIFKKCLSVGLSICMPPKFCGHFISRTNSRELMKFIFSRTLMLFEADLILVEIASEVSLLFEISDFFNTVV